MKAPADVWAAVQNDPALIVIDNFSIDRGGDPTSQRNEDAFAVTSHQRRGNLRPRAITITGADGQCARVHDHRRHQLGAQLLRRHDECCRGRKPGLRAAEPLLPAPAGRGDARATAMRWRALSAAAACRPPCPKSSWKPAAWSVRSIFYLIQGFIGLGLLIGIAALGVVTIRAVVERRQQIGVLRAIGFTREMVQNVFLFEGRLSPAWRRSSATAWR
jgi:hypothetical protein